MCVCKCVILGGPWVAAVCFGFGATPSRKEAIIKLTFLIHSLGINEPFLSGGTLVQTVLLVRKTMRQRTHVPFGIRLGAAATEL